MGPMGGKGIGPMGGPGRCLRLWQLTCFPTLHSSLSRLGEAGSRLQSNPNFKLAIAGQPMAYGMVRITTAVLETDHHDSSYHGRH